MYGGHAVSLLCKSTGGEVADEPRNAPGFMLCGREKQPVDIRGI